MTSNANTPDGSIPTGMDCLQLKGRQQQELRIGRILVPTDFSECAGHAVDYGLQVARQFGATVILLHVIEPAIAVSGARFTSPGIEESSRHLIEAAQQSLAPALRRAHQMEVTVESLVRVGRAYSEITDTAKALACDLIVMGTRRAARDAAVLGSNADWVVHHASCPVITINPS